jgi:hypothetical protein
VEALRKKESGDETQFTTKIGAKTSLGPRYFVFVKFSFPVAHSMSYYAETGRPPPLITRLYDVLLISTVGIVNVHSRLLLGTLMLSRLTPY